MLVSFVRRENANEYRGRAILSRNWFHAERDDFHCIVRSIPLYLDRIAEMTLVSHPSPSLQISHARIMERDRVKIAQIVD